MLNRRGYLFSLLLALALRLVMVLHGGERPLVGDEPSYDTIARNVAEGRGFQYGDTDADRHLTAMRGPSYVLFVAGSYKLAGRRLMPPLLAQVLLDVLSVWLVHRIALLWFKQQAPASIAAFLFAIYPPFIMSTTQLISETLTTTTLLLAVYGYFTWLERRRPATLLLAGLALGVCSLCRPQLGAVGIVLAFAAVPRLGWAGAARAAAIITATVMVVMGPWIVRNARVLHAFVPGVTQGGVSFWGGTAPIAGQQVGGLGDRMVPDSLRQALSHMSEVEASQWFYRDGVRVIREDPARYARLTVRKVFQLWFNLLFDDSPSRASLALALAHAGAFALAVAGALRARPDPVATRLLAALGVYWTVLHVPFVAQIRYALPYLPLLFCFTAAGISTFPPFTRNRHSIGVAAR